MAIIRSHTLDQQAEVIDNPGVNRALAAWEERLQAARAEGAAEARREMQAELDRLQAELDAAPRQQQEAVEAAREQWQAEWGEALQALIQGHAELQALQGRALAEAEQDCLALALAIASRILQHEVEQDPGWMRDLLHQALDAAPRRRACTVRLHPDDVAKVQERLAEVVSPGNDLPELQADACLPRGGCLVDSGGTLIDAGIAVSWERVAAELMRAVPQTVQPEAAAPASPSPADPAPATDADAAATDDQPAADDDQPSAADDGAAS